ncbi:hypothetical protein HDV04_002157 [Boothiomyces sp. JEL0838]|nr:hypothetical protein HDV04_002157 [Boothiomyces sp. JEL0838]
MVESEQQLSDTDFDLKLAEIIGITEDQFGHEQICEALLDSNLNVSIALEALYTKKRKAEQSSNPSKQLKFMLPKSRNDPIKLDLKNIQEHVPCVMFPDILPKDMALVLLLELLEESKSWGYLPVTIFQKSTRSQHTTCLYTNKSKRDYHYNGMSIDTGNRNFSELMIKASEIIAAKVNEEYDKRKREEIELRGPWKPDIAVVNHYEGPESSVGYHTDKMTYMGPRPVIASLSLGATRTFRLQKLKAPDSSELAQTYDILLPHNCLLVMFPPCQERFKHTVPKIGATVSKSIGTLISHPTSGTSRICITYRMTRPEYADNVPTCNCGSPSELRPVIKKEKTLGQYFYICGKGACNFFKWLEPKKVVQK